MKRVKLVEHHPAPPEPKVTGLRRRMRDFDRGIALTTSDAQAWYRLPGVPWDFLTPGEQDGTVDLSTIGYAALTNRDMQLRIVPRPFGVHEWARAYHAANVERGSTPPNPAAHAALLREAQIEAQGEDSSEPVVFLGVHIEKRALLDKVWNARFQGERADRELAKLHQAAATVDHALRSPGLNGVRVSNAEFGWLMFRSAGIGLPERAVTAESAYTPTDMWAFTEGVEVLPEFRYRLARVIGSPFRCGTTDPVERWVAVLAVGRMDKFTLPWLAHPRSLDFPVEVSARLHIETGKDALGKVKSKIDLFEEQFEQHTEIHKPPDKELVVVDELAQARHHEMSEGDPITAAQATWQVRLAVSAPTRGEVQEMCQTLVRHYRPQIELEQTDDQVAEIHGFEPGSARPNRAHVRTGQVRSFAAGMPTITSTVGDRQGVPLGRTMGPDSTRFTWDPFHGLYAGEGSGYTLVLGDSGAGKSTILTQIIGWCVSAGIFTSVLDPGGKDLLARVAQLPENEGHSMVHNALSAPPSAWSPYSVVADPPRELFYDDPAARGMQGADLEGKVDDLWRAARAEAESTRIGLAQDTLTTLLDEKQLTRQWRNMIERAVAKAPATDHGSLNNPVMMIKQMGVEGEELAELYLGMMKRTIPAKYFGAGYMALNRSLFAPGLLVITLEGAAFSERGQKPTRAQREFMPMLAAASHLLESRTYTRPMHEPKLVVVDEAGFLTGWESGEAMHYRWAARSRKERTRFIVATHALRSVLGAQVEPLIEDVFVGRTTFPTVIEEALRALRLRAGVGYEAKLSGLSPRMPDGTQNPNRHFVVHLNDRTAQVEITPTRRYLTVATPEAPIPGEWEAA